jgi:purine-binding chemotaxis protein CheW
MNLRGTVIPTIDLAYRLGMAPAERSERSAIVVVEAGAEIIGLLVDHVTDMLSVSAEQLQPVPDVVSSFDSRFCDGIITHAEGMICFINVQRLFGGESLSEAA